MSFRLAGREFQSRLLLGTAGYPSLSVLKTAIRQSGAEIVTVSLRRQTAEGGDGSRFFELLKAMGLCFLPNTAGCRSAREAIVTARMAREIFDTPWIKLETLGDEYTLQPDPFALIEAAQVLIGEGFEVFPYMTEDLVVAERLIAAGCKILMPWGSPIGSGRGLIHPQALKTLRDRYPDVTLIVDAGIGAPSHAAQAMELGFDAVLLNSAVSQSTHPARMAEGFAHAIRGGRLAYEAGLMPQREFAVPSTPVIGTPFWHHEGASS